MFQIESFGHPVLGEEDRGNQTNSAGLEGEVSSKD